MNVGNDWRANASRRPATHVQEQGNCRQADVSQEPEIAACGVTFALNAVNHSAPLSWNPTPGAVAPGLIHGPG
jgi:hypothetical protein